MTHLIRHLLGRGNGHAEPDRDFCVADSNPLRNLER